MSLNCTFELDGKTFQSEAHLDEYLKSNKDLANVGDYRFSKNRADDYIQIISEADSRIEQYIQEKHARQEVLEKVSNDQFAPTEMLEQYNDGYTSMTELAEVISGAKMAMNETVYFERLASILSTQLHESFPDAAKRAEEVNRRIEEKKASIADIRAAGKGLHNFIEILFASPRTNDYAEYVRERRDYIRTHYAAASLDRFDDQTLINLAKAVVAVKTKIRNGRKIVKVFIENYVDFNSNQAKFRGKMDTVVVYEDGTVDVIDFKISETAWENADINKRNVAENQLHLYKTALENMGIKSSDIRLFVFPVLVTREEGKYTKATVETKHIEPLSYKPAYRSELVRVLDLRPEAQPIDGEIGKTVVNNQGKMFGFDTITYEKDTASYKLAWDLMVGPPKGDSWSFKGPATGKVYSSKDRARIEGDLYNELQVAKEAKQQYAVEIKNAINGIDRTSNAIPFLPFIRNTEATTFSINYASTRNSWLNRQLYKYKSMEGWRVMDNPDLLQMGVLMFQNDITRQIDFVSITYDDIWAKINMKYGDSLLGNFKKDDQINPEKRMVPYIGNMELIKLMDIANQLQSDYTIGELKVLSLLNLTEFNSTVVRDKLIYNYNVLAYEVGIEPKKFEFTDTVAQVLEEGRNLLSKNYFSNHNTDSNSTTISDHLKNVHDARSRAEKLARMQELRDYIAYKYYNVNTERFMNEDTLIARLYNSLNAAIADLGNITLDFYNVKALSASLTGGPFIDSFREKKFLNSTLLNTADSIPIVKVLYEMFEDAANKLRNRYYAYKTADRTIVDKFKARGNPLYTNRIANRYDVVYKNLFDTSERGKAKLLLKDYRTDTTLNKEEREFLKWWLEEVNEMRFGKEVTLESLEESGLGERWFELPLIRAEMMAQAIVNGKPVGDTIWGQAGFDEVLDPKMSMGVSYVKTDFGHNQLLFDKMYNIFQLSEDEDSRNKLLHEVGPETFETNLERIKDMYKFSTLRQEIYNPFLGRASAALSAYSFNAHMGHVFQAHKDSIQYLVDYIRSSVMDESLVDEDYKSALRVVSALKSTASRLVLGFNILTTAKEGTVGLWTLMNHSFANRVDESRFGFKEAMKAYATIWKESPSQLNTIVLGEHLNFEYGFANMSVQEMVEKMNFFQGQVGRIDDRMFWCTRVCDYLHRMTVCYAYMYKYDCLKAHRVIDGHVEYDWKLDGRFSIYAKYKNEDEVPQPFKEKWREQRSLFEAMRNEMVEDGVEYVVDWKTGETKQLEYSDNFLPRAFTNNEARKMIQESNMMYGYMDTANKSMFFKKGIGILIGQFYTYISAKKNQYFLTPDVYQNGRWVYLKDEQGRQLYRTYDANGNPQVTTEDNGNPIKVWEGSMMGGIFWSLYSLAKSIKDGNWKEVWNDPNNKRNISILLGDMAGTLILLLLGWMLYGHMTKEEMSYWDRNVSKILNNASSELNLWKVITGQLEFKFTSYEIVSGLMEDIWASLTGNMNFWVALSSNFGILRPWRDMIYDYARES